MASGTGWVQATINSTTYGSVTLPQYPVVVGSPTPTITAIKVSGSGSQHIMTLLLHFMPEQLIIGMLIMYLI